MSAKFEKYVYAAYLKILDKHNYESLDDEQQEFIRSIAYAELATVTGLTEMHILSITRMIISCFPDIP